MKTTFSQSKDSLGKSNAENVSQYKDEGVNSFIPPKIGIGMADTAQRMEKEEDEDKPASLKANPAIQRKEDNVVSKMGESMGADFSNVNIHTNSNSATDVGALAYTQGNDIHFAPGQFKPDTKSGQELIGHELTHVVQQREGRVQPTTEVNGMPVNDSASLEREADVKGAQAASAL